MNASTQAMQLIPFYPSRDLAATRHFYEHLLGLELARDQKTCLIFRVSENAYLGFCEHLDAVRNPSFIITLVLEDVDGFYQKLQSEKVVLEGPPRYSERYQIYHLFARDPNGYRLELQRFDKPL